MGSLAIYGVAYETAKYSQILQFRGGRRTERIISSDLRPTRFPFGRRSVFRARVLSACLRARQPFSCVDDNAPRCSILEREEKLPNKKKKKLKTIEIVHTSVMGTTREEFKLSRLITIRYEHTRIFCTFDEFVSREFFIERFEFEFRIATKNYDKPSSARNRFVFRIYNINATLKRSTEMWCSTWTIASFSLQKHNRLIPIN